MRKFIQSYGLLFAIAGAVILLDQWTKSIVLNNLAIGEFWSPWPWLMPYVRIVHWQNTGAAFGILKQFGGVFTILAIVVSIAIIIYFPRVPRNEWPLRIALGLQLGGALGNLIDRLAIGHVTDYISVYNFAVFNVADASITLGVAVLILGIWYKDWREKRASVEASAETSAHGSSEDAVGDQPEIEPDRLAEESRSE